MGLVLYRIEIQLTCIVRYCKTLITNVTFGVFGYSRCYFILQGLCGISIWTSWGNCICHRQVMVVHFFIVTYNVELWSTSICLLFVFICHLSAIGQVSHSRKVHAFCFVWYIIMSVAFVCFLYSVLLLLVRIGSMDGCSLYKIKLIIRYAQYFDLHISLAGYSVR